MHPDTAYQIARLRVEENARNAVRRGPSSRRGWFWRRRVDVAVDPPRQLSPPAPRPQRQPGERRAA